MSIQDAHWANKEDLPKGSRWTKPKPVWSQEDYDEMHDALTLALDALGDSPERSDVKLVHRNVSHAKSHLQRAHKRQIKTDARAVK